VPDPSRGEEGEGGQPADPVGGKALRGYLAGIWSGSPPGRGVHGREEGGGGLLSCSVDEMRMSDRCEGR
jgi:hypothetical protein